MLHKGCLGYQLCSLQRAGKGSLSFCEVSVGRGAGMKSLAPSKSTSPKGCLAPQFLHSLWTAGEGSFIVRLFWEWGRRVQCLAWKYVWEVVHHHQMVTEMECVHVRILLYTLHSTCMWYTKTSLAVCVWEKQNQVLSVIVWVMCTVQ